MSSSDSGSGGDGIDPRELKALIELVCSNDISEFDLERGGFRLRIVKTPAQAEASTVVPVASAATVELSAPITSPPAAAEPAVVDDDMQAVNSPIVGTFFRASSPAAEPYVKAGDSVKVGQVLCIVEAMKLMNEIESDCAGTITEVLVENGQPVEFGEALFRIRPDR